MERNIDAMKYRKSTHLAGVDVEAIIAEKGKCVLTIKDAYYAKNVDVSGKKLDGYFLVFAEEGVKPMSANSTNRKTIASNLKALKGCSSQESRNIGNWIGLSIELYFDENVRMKGETVGGIRVKAENPIREVDVQKCKKILDESNDLQGLKANWDKLTDDEKKSAEVIKHKDDLKAKFENDKQ